MEPSGKRDSDQDTLNEGASLGQGGPHLSSPGLALWTPPERGGILLTSLSPVPSSVMMQEVQ